MAQGPDITFNTIVMGLGGTAELSIGVLVSCLPVLPRFVQHFGPVIIRSFSFHSASTFGASGGRFAHKLACLLGRAPAPENYHSGSQSTTVVDPNIVEQEIDREYVTFDLHELHSRKDSNRNKSLPPIPA